MIKLFIFLLIIAVVVVAYNQLTIQSETTDNTLESAQWDKLKDDKNSTARNLLRSHSPIVKSATGKIIWNKSRQQGMLRFVGLAKLDNEQAYYLWQYNLKEKYNKPIRLVQFNGKRSGSVGVSFKATALDKEPYKFLITIEDTRQLIKFPNIKKSLFMAQP